MDLFEDRFRLGLDPVGQRLDIPRAAQRIGDVGDAGLLHQHLLGPYRDLGGLLSRQRENLVKGIGVQGVGTAQYGRQGFDRGSHHVVVRLMAGQ